jgi:predicted dehydrogenase
MAGQEIRIGVVGACGRGGSFRDALQLVGGARVEAVCDANEACLPEAQERLGASEAYVQYDAMLDESALDAVVLGTPMPFHVPQAISALERGLHVLSEVPAGVSLGECRELVLAAEQSEALYMMAENYVFSRPNILVRELVRGGLFGTPYYAEGEYLHELKGLNEITRWRRTWQTGIDGVTYGTHSLGPILQWMPGERVVSVCAAGSGHHYRDPRGDLYENQDSTVMLCKLASGGLAKVRVDMLSERPHAMTNYQLQGTEGAYESARAPGERNRIWLQCMGGDMAWHELQELDERLPAWWRELQEAAQHTGHGGGDLYVIAEFLAAIREGRPPLLGIHDAMDMTLPGLCSQLSIAEGGRWVDVPDSRDWASSGSL